MCCISNVFGKKKIFEASFLLYQQNKQFWLVLLFQYSEFRDLNEFYDEAKMYYARNQDCKMFIS